MLASCYVARWAFSEMSPTLLRVEGSITASPPLPYPTKARLAAASTRIFVRIAAEFEFSRGLVIVPVKQVYRAVSGVGDVERIGRRFVADALWSFNPGILLITFRFARSTIPTLSLPSSATNRRCRVRSIAIWSIWPRTSPSGILVSSWIGAFPADCADARPAVLASAATPVNNATIVRSGCNMASPFLGMQNSPLRFE